MKVGDLAGPPSALVLAALVAQNSISRASILALQPAMAISKTFRASSAALASRAKILLG